MIKCILGYEALTDSLYLPRYIMWVRCHQNFANLRGVFVHVDRVEG